MSHLVFEQLREVVRQLLPCGLSASSRARSGFSNTIAFSLLSRSLRGSRSAYWQMLVHVDVGVLLCVHRRKHASRADSVTPQLLHVEVE